MDLKFFDSLCSLTKDGGGEWDKNITEIREFSQRQNKMRVNKDLGKEKGVCVCVCVCVFSFLMSFDEAEISSSILLFSILLGMIRAFYFISLCHQRADLNFIFGGDSYWLYNWLCIVTLTS